LLHLYNGVQSLAAFISTLSSRGFLGVLANAKEVVNYMKITEEADARILSKTVPKSSFPSHEQYIEVTKLIICVKAHHLDQGNESNRTRSQGPY
jgi:hypothetical protein